MTFENRLKGAEGARHLGLWRRVFQTEGIASANVLRQEWPVYLRKNRRAGEAEAKSV